MQSYSYVLREGTKRIDTQIQDEVNSIEHLIDEDKDEFKKCE